MRSLPTPSWIHDFPVTQNYAVLPETPVVFNLKVGKYPPGHERLLCCTNLPRLGAGARCMGLITRQLQTFEYFLDHMSVCCLQFKVCVTL